MPTPTRIDSVIQSLSKAYFRKNATPRISTIVPTHNITRPPMASSRPSGLGNGGGAAESVGACIASTG